MPDFTVVKIDGSVQEYTSPWTWEVRTNDLHVMNETGESVAVYSPDEWLYVEEHADMKGTA